MGEVEERLKKFKFKEGEEEEFGAFVSPQLFKTGYPKPQYSFYTMVSSFKPDVEGIYYWLMNHAKYDFAYVMVDKIVDLFAASEHSTFFGVSQQRLSIQQDRIGQYLATIGKLVKELFQLVRELRVIDERLFYYEDSWARPKENSSEISLKGMWIDLVEGGAKNPASVYGMARDLGFATLPDLFFSTPPLKATEVDKYVDGLDFNVNVKNVLKRKLKTFIVWKEKTYEELKSRKGFQVKYLRQHFDIIRMYMNWVKPYLRYVKKLHSREHMMDSPDLISSFEGSALEIEILCRKKLEGADKVWTCILMTFEYRSRPAMAYQAEGYQRGPQHAGEVRVHLRSYGWTDEEIANYKKMREEEDMELIGSIEESLKAAMDELGDDLKKYLGERGEIFKEDIEKKEEEEKKKEEVQRETVLSPFIGIFKGLGELFGFEGKGKPKGLKTTRAMRAEASQIKAEKKAADDHNKIFMYVIYKNFKSAHGMMSWR